MPNISVCIPCIEKHVSFLPLCLDSIVAQTYQPYEVVVVVSNIQHMDQTIEKLREYKKKYVALNIIFLPTVDTRYAGENRNAAVQMASGEIVTMMDADDVMHKDRLYILNEFFTKYPDGIGVLHYFLENLYPLNDENYKSLVFSPDLVEKYKFSKLLHFGHATYKRILFDEFQYSNRPRGQDVEFVHYLLHKYINNMYVYKENLSYYISNNSSLYAPRT